MATTDSANTASTDNSAGLGVSALLGLTTGNLLSKTLGTNQTSGVDYNALLAQSNALGLTALNSAQEADTANKALSSSTIMPAVSNQLGVAKTSATNLQDTASLVGGYSAADRAKARLFDGATSQYAQEVANYGLAGDQEKAAAKAGQTVLQQTNAATDAAVNTLQDMGVDTGSGKLASAIMQTRMQGAAKAADAENSARETTRQAGINARATAAQIGNTLANTATNEATQAATIDSTAAATAGQGIQNAVSAGNFASSGASDITNAANLGVNANIGIAKAQASDAYNYANLNNKTSSAVGAAATAAGTGLVNWLGSTSAQNAIKNGVSGIGSWLSGIVGGSGSSGGDTNSWVDQQINDTVDQQTQESGNSWGEPTGEDLTKEFGGGEQEIEGTTPLMQDESSQEDTFRASLPFWQGGTGSDISPVAPTFIEQPGTQIGPDPMAPGPNFTIDDPIVDFW